jgi:hypothetical protein
VGERRIIRRMNPTVLRLLLRAWALIAVVDGIFATTLPVVAYGQPLGRVWKGVASVLLGPSALQGDGRTILIGLVMHACVALAWTTVFLVLALSTTRLRRIIATPAGVLGVAALYGPAIWLVMSFVVIAPLTGRPPTINARWWVQLFAHIPFVALPIVATIGRGLRATDGVVAARPLGDAV